MSQGSFYGFAGKTIHWFQWREVGFELALHLFHDLPAWQACKRHHRATGTAFVISAPQQRGWSFMAEVMVPTWLATADTLIHEAAHCGDNFAESCPYALERQRKEIRAYTTEGVSEILAAWVRGDFRPVGNLRAHGLFKKGAGNVEYGLPGPTYEFSTTPNERGGRCV